MLRLFWSDERLNSTFYSLTESKAESQQDKFFSFLKIIVINNLIILTLN